MANSWHWLHFNQYINGTLKPSCQKPQQEAALFINSHEKQACQASVTPTTDG